VLAFGDSVMWGQGIAERSKFTTLVVNMLRGNLPVEVEYRSLAHSGATLRPTDDEPVPNGFDESTLATHGEIPNTYPTIGFQVRNQGPQVLRTMGAQSSDVDLILIDGCANDVDILNIVNPSSTPERIAAMTWDHCNRGMKDTLIELASLYPHARIVVTGYYQALSEHTDRTGLNPLFGGWAILPRSETAGIVLGVTLLAGPIAGGIVTAIVTEEAAQQAIINTERFRTESDRALLDAVAAVNGLGGNWFDRAVFVESGFRPENAYASKAGPTYLWLVPLGIYPNDLDEMHASRQNLCRAGGAIETSLGTPLRQPSGLEVEGVRKKCFIAALAHPNAQGAASYASRILNAIEPYILQWKNLYGRERSASR
jgi:hypothetical protein